MNRRTLLAALPAAAVVPGAALAEAETPVARKYAEWKHCLDDWNADMERDGSDENGNRWQRVCYGLADEILDIPSEGSLDFVYKLMAYTFDGEHGIDDGAKGWKLWAEARALVSA